MDKQYFTVEEANAMIPMLKEAFPRLMQLQAQVRQVFSRLEEAGLVEEGGEIDINHPDAEPGQRMDLAAFQGLVESLREELEAIGEQGALIKSIDSGLVDWFAQKDGSDIFLCWKLGEEEVKFWHPIETGVAGRRPVSEL